MKKNLNLIIISFFIALSITNIYGVVFCLPIFILYSIYNIKNIYYIIPISFISVYIFNKDFLLIWMFLIIFIILYLIILNKRNKISILLILSFLFNIAILMYINDLNSLKIIIWIIFISIISVTLLIVLYFLLIRSVGNFNYFEMITILIMILSASQINYDISLYLSAFYVMYFSTKVEKIFSFIFSIGLSTCLYIFYKENIFFILPIINSIYLIGNILSSFILIIFMTIISLFYPQYFNYTIVISFICIIYEIDRKSDYKGNYIKKDGINFIKEEYNHIFNNNVLAFATFLDDCINDSEGLNEKENKINNGIETIKENYCNRCYLKERCIKQFINTNEEIKNLIINCHNKDFIYQSNLLSRCPYNIEIRKSALITNSKINFENINNNNKIIKKVFSNFSVILRQYVIENDINDEIEVIEINRIKQNIINSGYDLVYFNIIRNYKDNFKIELGIRNIENHTFLKVLEKIVNKSFKYQCDIEFSHLEKDKTYYNIYDKKLIKIEYSTSNIASGTVSGDNLYINEIFA